MIYERIQKGRFLKRPNRFTAKIEINGKEETVHVKNTGRCAELLVPGAEVFVQKSESAERKTGWDLIGVRKADRLINMDSQVTNKVVQEWIEAGRWFKDVKVVRPEVTYKNSRFDLYVEYEEKKVAANKQFEKAKKLAPDLDFRKFIALKSLCENKIDDALGGLHPVDSIEILNTYLQICINSNRSKKCEEVFDKYRNDYKSNENTII